MVQTAKSCLQLLLKIVNSAIGIVGIAMVMYSIWMVRVWERELQGSSLNFSDYCLPWFIHAFLGIGIIVCAITCLGHIAANTTNPCCLSFYVVTIFVVLLVETGIIADIFLNSDWTKDLPEDQTGRLDGLKDFFESNFDKCKWIVLLFILAQGCSVLLATVLRTLRRDAYRSNYMYSSDVNEENVAPRLSLLDQPEHPLHFAVVDFTFPHKR